MKHFMKHFIWFAIRFSSYFLFLILFLFFLSFFIFERRCIQSLCRLNMEFNVNILRGIGPQNENLLIDRTRKCVGRFIDNIHIHLDENGTYVSVLFTNINSELCLAIQFPITLWFVPCQIHQFSFNQQL